MSVQILTLNSPNLVVEGEKLTDEDVDSLFANIEDTSGHINYEG